MNEIMEILKTIKPGAAIDENTELIASGVLTSLDIVRLASMLADEFDVEVSVRDIIPSNFETVGAIAGMVERLQEDA